MDKRFESIESLKKTMYDSQIKHNETCIYLEPLKLVFEELDRLNEEVKRLESLLGHELYDKYFKGEKQ